MQLIHPRTISLYLSQAYRVCDWWTNVDCPTSEQLYSNNEELYRDAEGNLIWGAASREVGGDDDDVGPEVFSTTTRTPLEQPLAAKLIDQHLEEMRGEHQRAHTVNHIGGGNGVHEGVRKGSNKDYSRSESSGVRMRFHINKNPEVAERVPFLTLVHKNTVEVGEVAKKKEPVTIKLLSSNDINNNSLSNYSALTGKRTNPKEALGQDRRTTKYKGSRGSKKYRFNAHDKDEVEYMRNSIAASTTTRRTTTKRSTFPNKYNIDYDHMLEDEYEIIQKVE